MKKRKCGLRLNNLKWVEKEIYEDVENKGCQKNHFERNNKRKFKCVLYILQYIF